MANTKFDAKSFNAEAFGKYMESAPTLKRNELLKSRALKSNSEIRNLFSSQTTTSYGRIPMYGNLEGDALNYDGMTDITADTTVTYERGVVVVGRAKAWMEKDFSQDITAGVDFMANVRNKVASFWEEIDQDTLLSILKGIFSMTGTENKKFVDAHTLDITKNGDGKVSAESLNTTIQKACGDNKNKFSLAIMHSSVATNLENLNLLTYLKYTDEQGIQRDLGLATWNGRTVLIDDSMPVEDVAESASGADDGYTKYTTYILGDGAFDYEDIGAKVPYEMDRDPKTNGGQDTLYTRQRKVFAPCGISYEKKKQVSLSPTKSELEDGSNWTLVNDGATTKTKYIDHKSIAIAQIISKG
ncbi:phage coat protein [Clostridioides difficile]|uniref:phage coat protein n=1 Tax=Clostridioides difficile TaxID=1496 RepID=UPI001C187299|nr:phage coat protein [Clostridioides difficile]EGT5483072.1 phage coat protein [Clostridioides difficile]MDA0583720.1 phage coat protein [Clostridioides difficile]MDA3983461.1 phage coat protein [Clostridioides difficile]MDA3987126.1 phage coat protein [Clostridioides difficile]UYJ66720.1 phage coat protein [Clostridioides difficile]